MENKVVKHPELTVDTSPVDLIENETEDSPSSTTVEVDTASSTQDEQQTEYLDAPVEEAQAEETQVENALEVAGSESQDRFNKLLKLVSGLSSFYSSSEAEDKLPPIGQQLSKMLDTVQALSSNENIDNLADVLQHTIDLFDDDNEMNPEEYQKLAENLPGKASSPSMKALGGIMTVIGSLAAIAGVTATIAGLATGNIAVVSSGIAIAGVGISTVTAGLGFFGKGQGNGLKNDINELLKQKPENSVTHEKIEEIEEIEENRNAPNA